MNAAQATCTISVDVTSSIAGHLHTTPTPATSRRTARVTTTGVNATLTVAALPDAHQGVRAATVGVGQNSALTFTITNPAGAPARTGLTFTDTLPAGARHRHAERRRRTPAAARRPSRRRRARGAFTVGGTGVNSARGPSHLHGHGERAPAHGGQLRQRRGADHGDRAGCVNGVTNQTLTVAQASLTKAFGPTTIAGRHSTLTFTITNGAGNPAQCGHQLHRQPAGRGARRGARRTSRPTARPAAAFAAPGGGFTVAAARASAIVAVTGAQMNGGVASCQVRVDVTAAIGGAYTNNAASITGTANVDATRCHAEHAHGERGGADGRQGLRRRPRSPPAAPRRSPSRSPTPTRAPRRSPPRSPTRCPRACRSPARRTRAPRVRARAPSTRRGANTVTLPAGRSIPAAVGAHARHLYRSRSTSTGTLGGTYTNTHRRRRAADLQRQQRRGGQREPHGDRAWRPRSPRPSRPADDRGRRHLARSRFTLTNPNARRAHRRRASPTRSPTWRSTRTGAAGGTCAGAAGNSFTAGADGLSTSPASRSRRDGVAAR